MEFFENDEKKYFNTSEKSVNICLTKLQDIDKAVSILEERIIFSQKIGKDDKVYHTNSELVRVLGQNNNLTEKQMHKLKASLLEVISENSTTIQNSEHMKTYIKLLYKLRDMEELLKIAFVMNKLFPEIAFSLEWICKVYLEYVTNTLNFRNEQLEITIETHVENLLGLNETSTLGRLAQAALIWNIKKDIKESSKLFKNILEGATNPNFYALYIFCQCQMSLNNFDQAENSLNLAIASLSDKVKDNITRTKLEKILQSMLANACYEQGKFEKVLQASKNTHDRKDILIKSYAHLGMKKDVENLLEKVGAQDKYLSLAIIEKQNGNSQEALKYLSEIKGDIFEAILLKGQIYWESEQVDHAQQSFLLAAKTNPYSWMPFFYLGEFYKNSGM